MAELSLVQLRHFCAVAELGSISEAARQTHVSATAIGAAVSNLERTLDTVLCHRERSRGVTLTPNGHHFYKEARRVIRDADDLLRFHPEGGERYAGPLQVGAFATISPVILPELLEAFEAKHPDVPVEFTTGTSLDLVERMLSGDLHCFFSYDVFSRSRLLPAGLTMRPLYQTELRVVISPDHPLARRGHLSIDDLKDEPMIVFESNPQRHFSSPALGQLRPDMKVRYRTREYELMRSMVARGLGYSLVMNPIPAGRTFDGGRVTTVPLDPPLPGTSVVVVLPEGRWQHPATHAIVEIAHRLAAAGGLGASQ